MKLFKQKKGIILHPFTWIVFAFILGMILMYIIMKGILKVPYISC
ncbi:MAG: hypothetical protein U9R34_04195 [Nanoarchaeota archaeon]|nr:hypothetical protein [Nanoarchaeota archaeon]